MTPASDFLHEKIALPVHKVLRTVRRSKNFVSRLMFPVLKHSLQDALAELGSPPAIVFVHSSLSACGFIPGGAETVISALRAWCAESTLAMPTHSYCYPDAKGELFDVRSTPSKVGAITNSFVRQPHVLRSLHPTHSLAAVGPLAPALIAGHGECCTPCGFGTPYERLVNWDAGVLMFGVSLECYTLFHTAEDAADVPYLYEDKLYELKFIDSEQGIRGMRTKRQNMHEKRRFAEMDTWLQKRGLLERRQLGRAEILWIPHSKDVHAAVVRELVADPLMLLTNSMDGRL